jgi:hypothetical protein
MGSSKIILVSGLCVMLGFYAYVIQKASSSIVNAGSDRRASTQARMLSNAAMHLGTVYLSTPGGEAYYTVTGKSMSGGTVSWWVTTGGLPADQAMVTAMGVFGVDTVSQVALLSKTSTPQNWGGRHQWNQWGVVKIYTNPTQLLEEPIAEMIVR